jgi:hypothetical protein
MEEPRFAVFVRNWHPPLTNLETVPGQWRWEEGWPIERIKMRSLYPAADRSLGDAVPAGPERTQILDYVPTSGAEAGGPVMWWGDPTPDQRPSDAHALVYESEPLAEDLEILGFPQAHLNVSSSAPVTNWFARLSDVAPGGAVSLVAGAGFNGTHRESSRQPTPLVPGEEVALDIEMHFTSWVFPAGHRIRLAVSNAQWPMFWPSPGTMSTTLRLGGNEPTHLEIPVVAYAERPVPDFLPPAEDPELPGFGPLESGTSSGYGEITSIQRFPVARSARVIAEGGDAYGFPWGNSHYTELITHETSDTHPEATSVTGEHSMTMELPGRTLRWEGSTRFESDKENFYYSYTRRLFQDGKLLREKSWEDTIPRDHQ